MGGLSAAIRLAGSGWRVKVLEKNPRVGGKLNLRIKPHPQRPTDRPFRFDTGPSLLTLPFVFEDLFAAAGRDVRNYLRIKKLQPISRFVWPDGQTLELYADEQKTLDQIARFSPLDVKGFKRFLNRGRRIWERSAEAFLFHSPEQTFARLAEQPLWKRGLAGLQLLTVPLRIGMLQTFRAWVDREIGHPRLREVLYQYATYSGASPYLAPATLAVIPFAEMHFGGWYVEGGMYALAEQLHTLATELGVEIRTNTTVERILIDGPHNSWSRRVIGVRLNDGEELQTDIVVVNSDLVYTYRNLVEYQHRPSHLDPALDKLDPGGSGMVLLLGVDGTYPHLAHHTKFMPDDYRRDLDAMFLHRSIPDDPCIYVCATTRTDPTQAPDGCENLFVLCSAPPLEGKTDWRQAGQAYRDRIVHNLEHRYGLKDLSARIVVEERLTPADFRQLYNANAGSIYGLGSNSRQAAFRRPPNRDKDVRGLYFAGSATHPGGGLPLVALSGKIVSELIAEDFGRPTPI